MIVEHRRVGTNVNVRVDQRSATDAGGDDRTDPLERAYVIEPAPLPVSRLLPEQIVDALDVAREVFGAVAAPALEHQNAPASGGESRRGNRATESRTNDDGIERTHDGWSTVLHQR